MIFHANTYNLSAIKKKNIKITRERVPKIHLSGTPQNYQGHQIQEKPEKLSLLRGDEGDMISEHNVVYWAEKG